MASRFEAEKFTGKNDFALWRMKVRAMLTQQGLASALVKGAKETTAGKEAEASDVKATPKDEEIEAKAFSTIVLCLGDKVLREVSRETTAAGIMQKLEDLYLTKSLANRLLMKQRLYSYKFVDGKSILEQLEDFDKTVDDLENIDISIGDEDKAILLLNALPPSYEQLRDAILYGREKTISFLEVQSALRSKELQKGEVRHVDLAPESLNIKKFKGKKRIHMTQPKGFVRPGEENKVCLLKRSIYGLKQASRQWHMKFNQHVMKKGFMRSAYDECVYIKKAGGAVVAYLLLYVDDMLLAGADLMEINKVKSDLKIAFEMKDLGPARKILGMSIVRNRERRQIWLSQSDYVSRLINKFKMGNVKQVGVPMGQHFKLTAEQMPKADEERLELQNIPYANIVGSAMYAMISTRPDIAQAISVTSRYMSNFGKEHWSALKWLMRYLKGTQDVGILFDGEAVSEDALIGWSDSDFAGNLDNRRSQSGYLFTLFGSIISWKSSQQGVVALSTTEAEFLSLTAAVKEACWLKGILGDFGVDQQVVSIGCDNNSALCLAKHSVYHERSKHIDVRLHFIRERIEEGEIKVFKVDTSENPADMLTKPIPRSKLDLCMKLVGLRRGAEVE